MAELVIDTDAADVAMVEQVLTGGCQIFCVRGRSV
jgi:hypothetical protein